MRCRVVGAAFCVLSLLIGGCASPVISPVANNIVILLPGIGGNDLNYRGVCPALAEAGCRDRLEVFDWGPGWPLFFVALSWNDLHEKTEIKLANVVTEWRTSHPNSRIVLIGHSAGAGVILGTLRRLDARVGPIGPVILLAPSLSPDYDLRPALAHASVIHVFFSDKDDVWQGLGSIIFGGYDGVHRNGAGRRGFNLANLDESQKRKVIQHPYDSAWEQYGEHGGHFDWMKKDFVERVLEPLIDNPAPTTDAH